MAEWRIMPAWTIHYLSDSRADVLLRQLEEEMGSAELQHTLLLAGLDQMREATRVDPALRPVFESLSDEARAREAIGVGRLMVLHGHIIDRVRDSIVRSQRGIMGHDAAEVESEAQILLSLIFLFSTSNSIANPQMLGQARKAALGTFAELVGDEGIRQAQMGGPDFIFQQCLGEIVLKDPRLQELVESRLPLIVTR